MNLETGLALQCLYERLQPACSLLRPDFLRSLVGHLLKRRQGQKLRLKVSVTMFPLCFLDF